MSDNEDEILTKQQTILDNFFELLGHFLYDKAKEYLEKEKESLSRIHQTSSFFCAVLNTLCQLAAAEKSYMNFTYFHPKGFLRKDISLKSIFESLKNEFQRLEQRHYITPIGTPTMSPTLSSRTPSPSIAFTPNASPSASELSAYELSCPSNCSSVHGNFLHSSVSSHHRCDVLDNLICHLCGQLLHFICARLEMMEFYVLLHTMANSKIMNAELMLDNVTQIIRSKQKHFHHPLLSSLKGSFSAECEILMKLLECQVNMKNWRFLPSLLCLYEAHTKLGQWATVAKEKKGATNIPRNIQFPLVYTWLGNLRNALVSKFTLYFHEILSKQTTPQDMKSFCLKMSVDYFQRIVAFQKKYDAACIAIVLNTNGLDDYRGSGYVCADKVFEGPKGVNSYPAIVCYPPESPTTRWPSLVMFIDNQEKEVKNIESVVTFYDKMVNSTYFLTTVESPMTLVIIFETKKSERDSYVSKFMTSLCVELRCTKIFASVKPGSK